MSVDAGSSVQIPHKAMWISEEDVWEPPQPVMYVLKMIDLMSGEKDPAHDLGVSRELRLYASKWISSLKLFKYDHDLARYIVMNGLPESLVRKVTANLEDLAISTSVILSEDRISLSDAISYMELLDRSLGLRSWDSYISALMLRGGRLSDIASRVALLILYIISFYIAAEEEQ